MKTLSILNPHYRHLEQSFKEWLDIQGYAATTVYNLPNHLRELLHYLENQNIHQIQNLEAHHIEAYYEKLKVRSHQRKSGGLSNGQLNKHIQTLRKLIDYLNKTNKAQLSNPTLKNEEATQNITYLTPEEIESLYEVSYQVGATHPNLSLDMISAMQSRDRVMLSIYYGCGLRRNEGVQLNVSDINFTTCTLHVRVGKNHRERLVPIDKTSIEHLQSYLYDYRYQFLKHPTTDALLLSRSGQRLQGQSLLIRLKKLQSQTQHPTLVTKTIGLHTLRHSIATHLLASGMSLTSISKFLGHSTLESTQIYTHLSAEGGLKTYKP